MCTGALLTFTNSGFPSQNIVPTSRRKFPADHGGFDRVLTRLLRLDPHGDYVFLDLNPQGQYLYVELRTGQPMTRALVDLLIDAQRSAAGTDEVRPEPVGLAA